MPIMGRAVEGLLEIEATDPMQRDLVIRAKTGDHEAFTALATAAIARLHRTARLIVRDQDLASDAVQDALMAAWLDIRAVRDPDRFDAWLHRLIVHACLDVARRRRRRVVEVELTPIAMPFVGDTQSAVADRELLDHAMRRLEPEWRAVVVLHYYLGMPLPDVASELRIPLGTAKSRLHRSLGVMRTTLAEQGALERTPLSGGQPA
jgi:RNA polymerase sigma-70 factor (ECF subfamily)